MFADLPLLSLVIWTPIIGGLLVLAVGSGKDGLEAKVLSLIVSIVTFLISIPLIVKVSVISGKK